MHLGLGPRKKIMDPSQLDTSARFFAPALDLIEQSPSYRNCPSLSDQQWLKLGVSRVISAPESGRGFLQGLISQGANAPGGSHFFETLKSKRRLALCAELSEALAAKSERSLPDVLSEFKCLEKFEVRAGDGHWHGAASFDPGKISSVDEDGTVIKKRYPVGHLYTLDLRRHIMRHLMTSDQDLRRKEHDMRGLKRAGAKELKAGMKKGRKLLMVWDSAAIDFGFWNQLKQGHGVYFLCREKNIERIACGNRPWDREDPLNHGVTGDRQVGSRTNGHLVRIVDFCDEATGKIHHFVTNEMTLPPGVLAHLYRMRWDIEKVFDEVKNRLNQKKAWATSTTAKTMQGHFVAMTHNLMMLIENDLRNQEGIFDKPELERRILRRKKESKKANRKWDQECWQDWLHRSTQRGVKFIRWLRAQLSHHNSWSQSCDALSRLYARL